MLKEWFYRVANHWGVQIEYFAFMKKGILHLFLEYFQPSLQQKLFAALWSNVTADLIMPPCWKNVQVDLRVEAAWWRSDVASCRNVSNSSLNSHNSLHNPQVGFELTVEIPFSWQALNAASGTLSRMFDVYENCSLTATSVSVLSVLLLWPNIKNLAHTTR